MVKQHTAITGDLRSQLLENRWLEAERGSGDAEKCPSTSSPGYGPSSLCFGQVPVLLSSDFLPVLAMVPTHWSQGTVLWAGPCLALSLDFSTL